MKLSFVLVLSVWLTVLCLSEANTPPHAVNPDHHHAKSIEQAHGDQKKDEKHVVHKQTKKSGKKSSHDEETSNKGEKLNEKHVKTDDEHGGKKTEHFSQAGHQSFKQLQEDSQHGAKAQEGAHHKKGNYKKGFREKYHKDELKKHDSFYSNSHKSGEYNVFGKKSQKHQTHSLTKKKANNHKNQKSEDRHGKSGKSLTGQNVDVKKGHQESKAGKSHHEHSTKWAKKSSKKGGKQFKQTVHK
ncbi:filaggrin [Aethina tumida]|uniref:filaggrin n=1 Tax=Aethina tumida TaxID=116153 RepID=UPI00096B3414|nr:filaggrin [Aethina tumida]